MAAPVVPFESYFDWFLRAHESPGRRALVLAGTTLGVGCAVVGILGRRLSFLVAAPLLVAAPSIVLERSAFAPAPGGVPPSYRLVASLRFCAMAIAGTLGALRDDLDEPVAAEPDQRTYPAPNMVTDHTLH